MYYVEYFFRVLISVLHLICGGSEGYTLSFVIYYNVLFIIFCTRNSFTITATRRKVSIPNIVIDSTTKKLFFLIVC